MQLAWLCNPSEKAGGKGGRTWEVDGFRHAPCKLMIDPGRPPPLPVVSSSFPIPARYVLYYTTTSKQPSPFLPIYMTILIAHYLVGLLQDGKYA